MIKRSNIKFDFSNCNEHEINILSKYWEANSEGQFKVTLKEICSEFNKTTSGLYTLARHNPIFWTTENCQDCKKEIIIKLTKRIDLVTCLKGFGTISTFREFDYYKKCEDCHTLTYQKEDAIRDIEYINNLNKDPF